MAQDEMTWASHPSSCPAGWKGGNGRPGCFQPKLLRRNAMFSCFQLTTPSSILETRSQGSLGEWGGGLLEGWLVSGLGAREPHTNLLPLIFPGDPKA